MHTSFNSQNIHKIFTQEFVLCKQQLKTDRILPNKKYLAAFLARKLATKNLDEIFPIKFYTQNMLKLLCKMEQMAHSVG